MSDLNTSIRRKQLKPILSDDLDATNSPSDNQIPSYDDVTKKFTWVDNAGVTNIEDLGDVDFDSGTPADDYIMRYDSASGKWKAENANYTTLSEWNQNGFENRTDSTLTWTDSTPDRTLSIQPSSSGSTFDYWVEGVKYTSSGDTRQITDVEGIHIIYYDGDTLTSIANPTSSQMSTLILTKALVSIIYWDTSTSTAIYVGEERHGKSMSPVTHNYLHFTIGLAYLSGLGLNTINADGTGVTADAQFGADAGRVLDEDISLLISAITSTTGLPIYYLLGASEEWQKYIESGFSVRTSDGTSNTRLAYNQYTGGAWQLTEVGSNNFVLCHVFATTEKDNPLIAIMGQEEYNNVIQARTGALTEIKSIVYDATLSPETRPIATVIFKTNLTYTSAVNGKIVSTDEGDDYIDWRNEVISRTEISTTSHNGLTSLQGGTLNEYFHLTSADYTELSEWLDNAILGSNGLLTIPGLILDSQAVNPMGSGQEGIWIDSDDSKLYHFDGTDSKVLLNTDHTSTYNHTNIHEQNKDTYLAFGTVDQVSAGDVKDAVDKKHTQNTDTKLDEGGANETTASELRTALDTTIPGKANKVSGGIEDNFMSIDASGHPQDSGHAHGDYALSGHDHDTEYLALDNTTPFTPDADYEPATKKYIDDALVGGGFGDMFKNVYDTDNDGIVDYAEAVDDGTSGQVNRSTASEIKGAVDDSHTHSNKALLDTYDQTNVDLSDAISKKHDRQHAIDSTSDHTSSITQNNLMDGDVNGLPDDSGLAVVDVSDAITKKHSQNTDVGTNQDTFSIGDGTEDAHKLLEANIGQSGTQPGIRYNKDTDTWQISNDGSTWEDIEAGTGSGDMLKSTYDTDADGIVDKAESIDDGVNSATASEIKGAVDDSHTHSNKALLDTYDQTNADITDAISKKHDRQHALNSTSDHTSSITENNLMDADANGLPVDSGLSVTDVSDAITKKHSQNTDVGTSSDDFAIGDGTDTDKTITADNGDANEPKLKYDAILNKWRFTNDGTTFLDIGSGGSLTVKAVDDNPTITNVSEIQIDESTGLTLTELSGGIAKIGLGSHWKDLEVDGQSTLTPSGEETLEFEAGSGIAITTNAGTTPKKIIISASGSATSYRTSFDSGDISSADILSVTHSLNQKYVVVSVYNNSDEQVLPDITLVDSNNLNIDLSGFTVSGTWNVVVVS